MHTNAVCTKQSQALIRSLFSYNGCMLLVRVEMHGLHTHLQDSLAFLLHAFLFFPPFERAALVLRCTAHMAAATFHKCYSSHFGRPRCIRQAPPPHLRGQCCRFRRDAGYLQAVKVQIALHIASAHVAAFGRLHLYVLCYQTQFVCGSEVGWERLHRIPRCNTLAFVWCLWWCCRR